MILSDSFIDPSEILPAPGARILKSRIHPQLWPAGAPPYERLRRPNSLPRLPGSGIGKFSTEEVELSSILTSKGLSTVNRYLNPAVWLNNRIASDSDMVSAQAGP